MFTESELSMLEICVATELAYRILHHAPDDHCYVNDLEALRSKLRCIRSTKLNESVAGFGDASA